MPTEPALPRNFLRPALLRDHARGRRGAPPARRLARRGSRDAGRVPEPLLGVRRAAARAAAEPLGALSESDRARWNARHAAAGEEPGEPSAWLAQHAELLARLAPGRALDVASGRGRNAFALADLGFEVD